MGGRMRNPKIRFISAGAGSGKTYALTQILYGELTSDQVKPGGVLATTFTRKAATELRERVRGHLIGQGAYMLANAMGQAERALGATLQHALQAGGNTAASAATVSPPAAMQDDDDDNDAGEAAAAAAAAAAGHRPSRLPPATGRTTS